MVASHLPNPQASFFCPMVGVDTRKKNIYWSSIVLVALYVLPQSGTARTYKKRNY